MTCVRFTNAPTTLGFPSYASIIIEFFDMNDVPSMASNVGLTLNTAGVSGTVEISVDDGAPVTAPRCPRNDGSVDDTRGPQDSGQSSHVGHRKPVLGGARLRSRVPLSLFGETHVARGLAVAWERAIVWPSS